MLGDNIPQVQLADVAGALSYRQGQIDKDAERRKEIVTNQLAGQALSAGLQEGTPLYELAKANPSAYVALSKTIGIDPADGSGMHQMATDSAHLAQLMSVDDSGQLAAQYMQSEADRRSKLGMQTDYLTKGLQHLQENPNTFKNAITMAANNFNPPEKKDIVVIGKGGVALDPATHKIIASNQQTQAEIDKDFRGQVVHGVNGDYVYTGKGTTATPLTDESGKQIVSAAYDPNLAGRISGAKTGAEVSTKQSLDLADKYYQRIAPINNTIANYDDALRVIDSGAGTGKVESMLPSFKQASIELDNVRRNLGLNVIQNTTFGALSEGELKLALDTALPTGLNPPELKNWIAQKKNAQVKMRDYLENAVSFLGEGHTISELSKLQKNERDNQKQPTVSNWE